MRKQSEKRYALEIRVELLLVGGGERLVQALQHRPQLQRHRSG